MATLRTAPCNCDGGCQKCEYTGSVLWTDYSDDKVISSTPLLRPRIAQLEAENAALKAEVERLTKKLDLEKDVHRNAAKQALNALAENAALKAELAEVRADAEQTGHSMEKWAATAASATNTLLALRARLERAEAVCETSWELQERDVMGVGRSPGVIMDEMQERLAKWREGRA